ncbi:hypothetical protein Riv7116_5434 [Rivularia sp. PCC 7116]|uniref:hypothetical protein n=1 Tax=Rivularia sp. PCC 7116 TaxID=373994 RepID=UPI00029ECC72|nr:hypothetical protein [Rivularia sp. PCC 7116]AFY57810.1 hypothetical protein Riv7116_5434 [Rivularia sp. PCC 7116]
MLNLKFLQPSQIVKKPSFFVNMAVISAITFSSGCTFQNADEVQIKNMNVQPIESSSKYKVSGKTNLPDNSIIKVIAVRGLVNTNAETAPFINNSANITRSILDRKNVEVKSGEWQAELNISHKSADGISRESWQNDSYMPQFKPEDKVSFIATFNPVSQWQRSDNKALEKPPTKIQQPQGKLVRVTNSGEKFVQATKTLSIPAATIKNISSLSKSKQVNDDWGNRYLLNKQLPSFTGSLPPATEIKPDSNTPLKASQQLR